MKRKAAIDDLLRVMRVSRVELVHRDDLVICDVNIQHSTFNAQPPDGRAILAN